MACDIATFRVRFPEFQDETSYPDARIQLFLDDAAAFHMGADEARWCNKYDVAQCYLAAHLMTGGAATAAGATAGSAGPILSKTAGGVSVTRGSMAKDRSTADDYYMSTSYGQQFLTLRDMCFAGVTVANQL